MSTQVSFRISAFPSRRSVHRGRWAPIYLEPLPGSGERLCIGVVVEDDGQRQFLLPVPNLQRLSCVYGSTAQAFAWAADLALAQVDKQAATAGLGSLTTWKHGIEGLLVGEPRVGAGTSLTDLASVALRQASSLYIKGETPRVLNAHASAPRPGPEKRLRAEIERLVVHLRPHFEQRFGRSYRTSQSARPIEFGYVSGSLVANFATLTADYAVGAQVDRAKARLWDLQQSRSGAMPLSPGAELPHELLVHRFVVEKRRKKANALRQAEVELEAEADKSSIRLRAMKSPTEIAEFLVALEPA